MPSMTLIANRGLDVLGLMIRDGGGNTSFFDCPGYLLLGHSQISNRRSDAAHHRRVRIGSDLGVGDFSNNVDHCHEGSRCCLGANDHARVGFAYKVNAASDAFGNIARPSLQHLDKAASKFGIRKVGVRPAPKMCGGPYQRRCCDSNRNTQCHEQHAPFFGLQLVLLLTAPALVPHRAGRQRVSLPAQIRDGGSADQGNSNAPRGNYESQYGDSERRPVGASGGPIREATQIEIGENVVHVYVTSPGPLEWRDPALSAGRPQLEAA